MSSSSDSSDSAGLSGHLLSSGELDSLCTLKYWDFYLSIYNSKMFSRLSNDSRQKLY